MRRRGKRRGSEDIGPTMITAHIGEADDTITTKRTRDVNVDATAILPMTKEINAHANIIDRAVIAGAHTPPRRQSLRPTRGQGLVVLTGGFTGGLTGGTRREDAMTALARTGATTISVSVDVMNLDRGLDPLSARLCVLVTRRGEKTGDAPIPAHDAQGLPTLAIAPVSHSIVAAAIGSQMTTGQTGQARPRRTARTRMAK